MDKSGVVKRADLTTYVQKNEDGSLESGVTIKADSCVYAKEPWEDRIIYDDAKNANAISLVVDFLYRTFFVLASNFTLLI